MTSRRGLWIFGLATSFGLAILGLLVAVLFLPPEEPSPERVLRPPVDVPPMADPGNGAGIPSDPGGPLEEDPGTASVAPIPRPRLDLPDQPGWTAPASHRDYGLDARSFIQTRIRTSRLGVPETSDEKTSVGPFLLAALPWKDSMRPEDDEQMVARKVVDLLREHRILSCASPVVLATPTRPKDPRTWQDARKAWIGIPVLPGTVLPRPLQGIPFEGAEVLLGPRIDAAQPVEENWPSLADAARAQGRQPTFPLIYRYTGWASEHPDQIKVQWMLPLRPLPTPPTRGQ
ncbi:MAG TPA: hypothetical protein PLQ97_10135 [Myxococcota bacterium]|nr:hypothetical protein [Myxococcota bacterium]HQK51237.1 hypothetical protein [Myxococcota bacterium]